MTTITSSSHVLFGSRLRVPETATQHIFIRLEAIGSAGTSAQYWINFTGRFGGVHAFHYNSAESEPIWMKSGAL